ncbi:MAG: hypothetical protein FJ221_14335 [Lentisphaerae bacterium]|nr:hypothetical protein [Lentisphaerota bacterium]
MNRDVSQRSAGHRSRDAGALEASLRAAAPPLAVPDGFEIRVMAAVRAAAAADGHTARAPAPAWRRPAWAVAAACAVVAVLYGGRVRIENRALAQAEARAAVSATVAASDWIAAWGDAAPERLASPMRAEVDNLVDDARRAATVLLAGLD